MIKGATMASPYVTSLALVFALLGAGCERQVPDTQGHAQASAAPLAPQQMGAGDVAPVVSSTTREAVDTLLGGREFIATKEQLDRAGPAAEVAEALRVVARDDKRRMQLRLQAISMLRFYPEPRTYKVYDDVLGDVGNDPALRRTSVKAASEAFPRNGVPLMKKALAQDDVPTREAAVRALGAAGTPEANALLKEHAAVERDPTVSAAAKQLLLQKQ